MLRFVLVACLTAFVVTAPAFAQQMEDVVHLKNGSIVRGTIIEQIPGGLLKIQTQDGSVFVYIMDEIAKISKKPVEMSGRVDAKKDAPVAETGTPSSQADEPDEPRPAPAVCLIGEHSGFPEADARTAALLVCDELRKQGISVGEPVYRAPYSASVYRVGLHRLGQKVLVRLSRENPIGTVLIERQLQLGNIEEMIPAAPRLVDALVHRKSLASTVDVESVVEQEARVLRKIPSQVSGEIGIFGIYGFGTDMDSGAKPGFKVAFSNERPSYAMGFEFGVAGRIEIDGEEIESVEFGFLGLGGRHFFNKQNFSPYVGGGFTYIISGESGNGLGGYAVGGIEALRFHDVGFKLELRVDQPFFELPTRHVPVTLGASLIFGGEQKDHR